MRSSISADRYDVIVLGSGISGGLVSVILANKGFKVAIVDGGTHPKFAIGESTIPHTSQSFELMGSEHKIPEILHLADGPPAIRKHITTSCGVKRAFGFIYHREGQEARSDEANLFGNVWREENHFYRQDIDYYLFRVAVRYGADAHEGTRVTEIELADDGVRVETDKGNTLSGRFLVDGTGPGSLLVRQLGLREEPTSLRTNSRTIFTHMIDVKAFEECVESPFSVPWSQGTAHHLFDGGWFWVIPFNNWKGATNDTISVGLSLDLAKYPVQPGLSPEQEFRQFLDKFPSVARQFENARAVRPWVGIPRLQYSSIDTVGDRFCLMSHTAGFVDALFSRGLINTNEVIRKLMGPLCESLENDSFSREAFAQLDEVQKRGFRYADMLVFGSYTAWCDYELWNAWCRIWAIGLHALESILGSYLKMGKHSRHKLVDDPIASEFEPPGYKQFVEACFDIIDKVASGELASAAATEELWKLIKGYDFEITLRPEPEFLGCEWAMKTAAVHDILLGAKGRHERWQRNEADPFVGVPEAPVSR